MENKYIIGVDPYQENGKSHCSVIKRGSGEDANLITEYKVYKIKEFYNKILELAKYYNVKLLWKDKK